MYKMAKVPVLGYQSFRTYKCSTLKSECHKVIGQKCSTLKSECHKVIGQIPDTGIQLKQLFKVSYTIEDVAGYTTASVGEREQWSAIIDGAEENKNCCKALSGKTLFSALYATYTVALQELKAVLKVSTAAGQYKASKSSATQEDSFEEVRRRKRHSTHETALTSKKGVLAAGCEAVDTPLTEVATRNFFAPKDSGYEHRLFRY
jgi:hypothetical protein